MLTAGRHRIGDAWLEGTGPELVSYDPATDVVCWRGRAATQDEVDAAVHAARGAALAWSRTPIARRVQRLEAFADVVRTRRDELALAISVETGKPPWEARTEVDSMIAKVPATIEAAAARRAETTLDLGVERGITRYRPLGVLAVLGPFNFPGHLPNGHVVPALLAGNTVVLKPSELAPTVGQRMAELWHESGLPAGVVNVVHGGRETGAALAAHPGHDGLLFTGSRAAGVALSKLLAERPEAVLALELGGVNSLVVHEVEDVEAAVYWTIQSAFATSGQRCTCARRLIVPSGAGGDRFVEALVRGIARVRVGPPTLVPEPFAGPLVDARAGTRVLDAQERLIARGAQALVPVRSLDGRPHLLAPGLLDVTAALPRDDEEIFGPLLQLVRVPDYEAALVEANATRYGLAAALFSDRREHWDRFVEVVRAGCVNWNRPTTGASGRLPFGGVRQSGNHRPAGAFMIDACADPVASLERERIALPATLTPGV